MHVSQSAKAAKVCVAAKCASGAGGKNGGVWCVWGKGNSAKGRSGHSMCRKKYVVQGAGVQKVMGSGVMYQVVTTSPMAGLQLTGL